MKKWILKTKTAPKGNISTEKLGINKNIAQILINRGIDEYNDIRMYASPSFEFLKDPFGLKDMDKAVDRIQEAMSKGEKICIFGDYDVDGVSSTSILKLYFSSIGYQVDYYIPNRLEEGYGLNIEAVDHVASMGTNLIITVDCGITSVKEVDYAKSLGMDVIVTDHHECQEEVPRALAVINPKQEGDTYKFKGICGCMVALKLIHALSGEEEFKKDIYRYLEIVSLATICDVMPVLDENRIIVKNGLEVIGKGHNLGMKELVDVCGLKDIDIRSSHLGFAIGPRINASGRLGFSNLGVELFTEKDPEQARKLAETMNEKNEERQNIEAQIYMQAEEMLKDPKYNTDKVLVLSGKNWHHGIIGIVASKLTEKYYKPTILLCEEGELATGSARSIKGFNLFESMSKCKHLMTKFGGHSQAAGLTMEVSKIEELRKKINEIADYEISEEDLLEEIKVEYEIAEEDINLGFVDELSLLEPFGIKNPTPYFMLRGMDVESARLIGKEKNHLKLRLAGEKEYDCIGFGKDYMLDRFDVKDKVDLIFQLDKNTFRGVSKVQFLLKDIRLNKPENLGRRSVELEKIDDLLSLENRGKEEQMSLEEIDKISYFDNVGNKKILSSKQDLETLLKTRDLYRNKHMVSEFVENTLVVVNTMEGYFRAKSDINIADNEKIDYIFLSNIDKTEVKVYNKIIIYDYFDDFAILNFLIKNKKKESELIFNFENRDFVYLKNKNSEMLFKREDFVKVYKYLSKAEEIKKYSDVIARIGLSPIKINIILNVLKDEELISYSIDYKEDVFKFKMLPKPSKKLDLKQNRIVKTLNSEF